MSTSELSVVRESLPQEHHMRMTKLDDSLFSKELAPHYMKLAGQLASSEMVPKCFRGKPQDLFIAWAMGHQIGISPEQAMQCIAVINGKPSMWGDDMLALCMGHKDFEDIIEEPIQGSNGVTGFRCTVKRKGRADKVSEFTLEMAKKAGLLGKQGPWTNFTERMLKLRARGFALRDAFPDALKGIKPREEVEDYIDAEYKSMDAKGLSRTEHLKQDYLTKTGKQIDEATMRLDAVDVSHMDSEAAEPHEVSREMDEAGEEALDCHSEIKRLIEETGFTEERLLKALVYYEAESIEALNPESARHFIDQLRK
jgi:hypothetical protein